MPTHDKSNYPPKWADRLLQWYCSPEHLEDVQGALYEYFHECLEQNGVSSARKLYALNVITHFKPHLIKKPRFPFRTNPIDMFKNNLKFSLRNLWKQRFTTALNVLGLTIGITCFLMIQIWVDHETSFDAFHEKSDRIYRISNTFTSESEQFSQALSGPALGAQLHKDFPQIEKGVRVNGFSEQVQVGSQSYFENNMSIVDASFFEVFDFEVLAGNQATFFEEISSIVLTRATAIKYFGKIDVVGEIVSVAGDNPMKVTGVIENPPVNSQLQFDMLLSMELAKVVWNQPNMDLNWGGGWFHTYLLLREGVDVPSLTAEINKHITPKLTFFTERNMSYEYFLQPLKSIHLESDLRYDSANNGSASSVKTFSAIALVVLLLACINYINLTTANAIKRAKEVGIKKVIGAHRGHLIFQNLLESTIIVCFTTLVSLGLIKLLLPSFESFLGHSLAPNYSSTILAAIFLGAIGLGMLSGLFPALTISAFNPIQVTKGQLTSGSKGAIIRKSLVVVQFTATAALIMAIITVNGQMNHIQNKDLGMHTDEVLYINFRASELVRQNRQVLTDRFKQHALVKEISFQRGAYPVDQVSNSTVSVETGDGRRVSSSLYSMWADPNYVDAFGMEMAAGRFFSEDFLTDSTQSVVVNEAAVESFGWGAPEDAVGREMGDAPRIRTVIGVIKDFNFEGLQRKVQPLRILPVRQNQFGTMVIRADLSEPRELLDFIEKTWVETVPSVPLEYRFMDEDLMDQYQAEFDFRTLFMFFSSISIVIACLGLFGLATASTNQRIKEIGIRKVLGASQNVIVRLISKDFVILVMIALVLATPLAWYGMDQWLQGFAHRIDFHWTFIVMAGLIALVVSLFTTSFRAIQAARSNPVKSLRNE